MNSPLLGGSAVSALVRRGLSPSLLMQQAPMETQLTPGAPGYNPIMQTPAAPSMPDRSPMTLLPARPQMPQMPQAQQAPAAPPQQAAPVAQKWAPVNEGEAIVNTLIKRLEALNRSTQKPGLSDSQEMAAFDRQIHQVVPDVLR